MYRGDNPDKVTLEDHPGQQYFDFAIVPNHEKVWKRPTFEEEYTDVPGADPEVVTSHMREQFYQSEGWFAPDSTVYSWWQKQLTIATSYTPELLKAFEAKGAIGKVELASDGGGGQNYYDLPPGAEQLLDLIEFRNMNGNVKDIFKACYRLGQKPGVTEEYDLRKMAIYSLRELGRVTGRKDYINLAREVIGHQDPTERERREANLS